MGFEQWENREKKKQMERKIFLNPPKKNLKQGKVFF